MENLQLPPELITAVFTAIATWLFSAANNARTSSSERAYILRRVRQLQKQLDSMQKKYELEVERGNRLEDELKQVRRELDEVKEQRDERTERVLELEKRLADAERRLTDQELKPTGGN